MSLDRPSLQTIRKRVIADIESRLTGNVSLLRRALLRVLGYVFSGIMHILYGVLVILGKNLSIVTCKQSQIPVFAKEWGVTRKESSFAEGDVTITGVNGTLVPQDTLLYRESDGFEYETLADVYISGGSASASVQATEEGALGNYVADSPFTILLLSLVSPIENISDTISVNGNITGGQDEEDFEDWRQRIIERMQFPPGGGDKYDYVRWAKEVNGVDDAWVFPTYFGAGSVVVVIKPADVTLATNTQLYIDDRKPVTANDILGGGQYVFPIEEEPTSFDISIDPNQTEVQDLITQAIINVFNREGEPGGIILVSHLRSAIASSGVTDYEITDIIKDGVSVTIDNIQYDNFEFPVLDTINFSSL